MSTGIQRCAALACLKEPTLLLVFPRGVWPQQNREAARDALREGREPREKDMSAIPAPYCAAHGLVVARAYGAEEFEPPPDVDLEELLR